MGFIKDMFKDTLNSVYNRKIHTREGNISWPSESMAYPGGIPVGACKREVFYKLIGEEPSNPINVQGQNICDAGLMYEEYFINRFKSLGILSEEQYKIHFPIPNRRNNIIINGRVDCIIIDRNIKKGIEIKSISAFGAPNVVGSNNNLPLPAPKNLMQAMIYKYYFSNTEEGKKSGIDEVYLMYVNRSDAVTFFYKIDLDPEGYAILTAYNSSEEELFKVKLAEHPGYKKLETQSQASTSDQSRLASLKFTIYDIFDEFESVYDYQSNSMLPPPDYKHIYTMEEAERKHKLGLLSTIKFNRMKKGKAQYGDNKCQYCSYRDKCLEDKGIRLS